MNKAQTPPVWKAWVAVARLTFYPLSIIAFLCGALTAGRGVIHNWGALFTGLLVVCLVEFAAVLSNELEDEESDRANTLAGPFNGGSRVLASGRLTRGHLRGARGAAVVLALLTGICWLSVSPSWSGPLLLVAALILGIGYSSRPLRLSYRTLGEVTVALVHGVLVVAAGYWTQEGESGAGLAKVTAALFLAILPSILLAGIPDAPADRSAGKLTVAVRFGRRSAAALAAGAVMGALVCLIAFSPPRSWVTWGANIHAVLLALWIILGARRREPGRIDALIGFSLAYIVWFFLAILPGDW